MPRTSRRRRGPRRPRPRTSRLNLGPGEGDWDLVAGTGNIPGPQSGAISLLGIPQSIKRELAVVGRNTVTCTIGAYSEVTTYLNSAFNSGTSFSAAGYAKYMQFYSKCFVIGARIVIRGTMTTIAANQEMTVGVVVTTNTSSLTSASKAIANGLCRWTAVYANPDRFRLTVGVDVGKFLNKPNVLDDPQLFSTLLSDPSQLVVAHVFAEPSGSTTAAIAFHYETLLDCVFTDPIPFT